MTSCKKCKETVNWNYCPNCGLSVHLKRIDGQYFIREIRDFLHVNKEMLHTIKNVLISPGNSIRQFLTEDRYRFVKPISFVIITSLIYTLVNYLFPIEVKENTFINPFVEIKIEGVPMTNLIFSWMRENFAYSNLLLGIFMAFWIKIVFKKYSYNFFEILILLFFVSGISTLFLSVGIILQSLSHLGFVQISSYVSGIYLIWAVGQFFDWKKVASYTKTFLSYIFGGIIFVALVVLVGILIDFITRH
ncbi:MAG: DUF3667 domain-containing protein [Bacteroidales bacterium]|nr:DUF3667 domain-containing protein [Bacteroidales bacterium]